MMPSNNAPRHCIKWNVVLACLISAYMLSIGPAAYVECRAGTRSSALASFYAPIGWLDKNDLVPALHRYVEFWLNLAEERNRHDARK
jgi:hypothetical protein